MQVNADFSQLAVLNIHTAAWVASPQVGVSRILLDRVGDEVARATSVVRFAADSTFPQHMHGGGEEILVLEGTFSDETGDYPVGSYLRNPPGSVHAPWSEQGCVILVKLWQFAPEDQEAVRCQRDQGCWKATQVPGLWVQNLHQHATETTAFYRCTEPVIWQGVYEQGVELLVLSGCLFEQEMEHSAGAWLRLPTGSTCTWQAKEGTLVYFKTGHLEQMTCWDQRAAFT